MPRRGYITDSGVHAGGKIVRGHIDIAAAAYIRRWRLTKTEDFLEGLCAPELAKQ